MNDYNDDQIMQMQMAAIGLVWYPK